MHVAIPDIELHLAHAPAVEPVPFDTSDAIWSLQCLLANGIGHGMREIVQIDAGHTTLCVRGCIGDALSHGLDSGPARGIGHTHL